MIKRNAKETLLRLSEQFPIVAIIGPRQAGKSTLAKETFPNKKYISFDNKNIRDLAASNPSDFLKAFPDGCIFDEVQKVPELFSALKEIVDNEKWCPGKYILTGSNQLELKKNINDSMAGRIAILKLLPFSIGELKGENLLEDEAYKMIFKGFYPPLHDKEKHFILEDWFDNYIDTYIDMDVKDQINPTNLSTFKKFIQICAIYSGNILNMDSIAKAVGVSAVTIKSWLSILENSFIIHLLEVDNDDLGRQLIKSPKLYFVDTGLLCHLLRIEDYTELILSERRGNIVETFAVSELLKHRFEQGRKSNITYFRDRDGFEVDVIADWKKTYAIEIKSTSLPEAKLSKNVRKYAELKQVETKKQVYYLGDLAVTIDGVDYVPWTEW